MITRGRKLSTSLVALALVALIASCSALAGGPSLTFEIQPSPNGVSGLVRKSSDSWTFGIPGLCLDKPGRITIRSLDLDQPTTLELVQVGVKQMTHDMGIGAVDEPMQQYGYRTDPLTITTVCPRIDATHGDLWSITVEVRPAASQLSGRTSGLTVRYTSDDDGHERTMRIPMTLQLCRPGDPDENCG